MGGVRSDKRSSCYGQLGKSTIIAIFPICALYFIHFHLVIFSFLTHCIENYLLINCKLPRLVWWNFLLYHSAFLRMTVFTLSFIIHRLHTTCYSCWSHLIYQINYHGIKMFCYYNFCIIITSEYQIWIPLILFFKKWKLDNLKIYKKILIFLFSGKKNQKI